MKEFLLEGEMKVTNYPQDQLLPIHHFLVQTLGSKNPVRVKEMTNMKYPQKYPQKEMTNIKYPQELRTRLRGEGREAQNYERERYVK